MSKVSQQQHECEDQIFGLKLTGFVQGQQRKSLHAIYLEIEHQKASTVSHCVIKRHKTVA